MVAQRDMESQEKSYGKEEKNYSRGKDDRTVEQKRLNNTRIGGIPWKKWGPYLSERQWGTVREDYK